MEESKLSCNGELLHNLTFFSLCCVHIVIWEKHIFLKMFWYLQNTFICLFVCLLVFSVYMIAFQFTKQVKHYGDSLFKAADRSLYIRENVEIISVLY